MAYKAIIPERKEDREAQRYIRARALKSLEILGHSLVVLRGESYLSLNRFIRAEHRRLGYA